MAGPYVNTAELVQNISNSAQAPLNWNSSSGTANNFPNIGSILGPIGGIVQFLIQQAANDAATNKQNAYNSPAAQMSRLTAAGINPYSAVNQIAGNNTSAPYKAANADILSSAMMVQQLQGQQLQNENMKIQNDVARLNLRYQKDAYYTKLNKMKADANRAYWTWQLSQGKVTAQEALNKIYGYKAAWEEWYNTPGEHMFSTVDPETGQLSDYIFYQSPHMITEWSLPQVLANANIKNIVSRTLGQDITNARNQIARLFESQFNIPFNNNNNFITALKFFVSPEGQKIVDFIISKAKSLFK